MGSNGANYFPLFNTKFHCIKQKPDELSTCDSQMLWLTRVCAFSGCYKPFIYFAKELILKYCFLTAFRWFKPLCLLEENHRMSLFKVFGSALACLALELESCIANKASGRCKGDY